MYAGNAQSKGIIRKYEMYSDTKKLTCHVLLATYESVTSPSDFGPIFKAIPRWEVLIVDEGQRRKLIVYYASSVTVTKSSLNS